MGRSSISLGRKSANINVIDYQTEPNSDKIRRELSFNDVDNYLGLQKIYPVI